jgi:multicomponent Na+:H+ antiporter subunit E
MLLLFALWLMLTAGDMASWMIGLPFIALAILLQPVSANSSNKFSLLLNISGLLQFCYFFIIESLRGGVDVSRRVLTATTRVNPVFYDYHMQLQRPYAQQLFVSSISLLPGTLCADIDKNRLRIHTLDRHMETAEGIKRLESLVGKIFGEII